MRVLVVSEFYPRRADPVLGVWAHRQALASAQAGADVHAVVLHRVVPPASALRAGPGTAARVLATQLRQPIREVRDGLPVTYVPFISPPRNDFYPYWGAWAAPPLALAMRRLRHSFAFDLVHAHNAVPAGDAVRRVHAAVPLVVSVHGGDVLYTAPSSLAGTRAVSSALGGARLVLANSLGTAALAARYGATDVRVVHLGADPTPDQLQASQADAVAPKPPSDKGTGAVDRLVTVAHLVARKRHADVLHALALLRERHPQLQYLIIGDGPEREPLRQLALGLGVADRVEIRGQLDPAQAAAQAQQCTLFVMPSEQEAFGVAYIEAMSAGVGAIGTRGEPGPQEIAAAGGGIELVNARDVAALADCIDGLLTDRRRLHELGEQARVTVSGNFTWQRCGERTYAAYEQALK